MLLPYWDRAGNVRQFEPYPQSFHDWAQGEDVPANQQGLHTAVKETLGQALIRTSCKAMDMNIMLDATLADGRSVILRQRHTYVSDPVLEKRSLRKFQNEINLLRWLRDNTSIPVPGILAIGPDYTFQEKMPGANLSYRWHSLFEAEKDNLISGYVNIIWELFHLSVPQKFGSASVDEALAAGIGVGPLLAANTTYSVPKILDDISEYVDFLFTAKRQMIEKMKPEDKQLLTHADLHGYNILVNNNGDITAVLDWEINRIQPAILGIDYPLWLSTQGVLDPRFASDSYWWEEGPAERESFCTLFEKKVQGRDPEMYKCLIEGRDLRAVVGWLTDTHADQGFDRLGVWAASQLGRLNRTSPIKIVGPTDP